MGSGSRATMTGDGSVRGGRFEIERCLGEGSMGAVYLAYDRTRAVRVALKTLRRVDASGIYRFKREFRALADVSHPNLVELHELFSEGNEWFFTMEYVEGQDFLAYTLGESARAIDGSPRGTRRLRGGMARRAPGMEVLFPTPLRDFERLRHVLQQVVSAVMALHTAGKLHRDLKPDNVMITREGRAVVLDFGISAERNPDAHGTLELGVMGTPAYMSPEQAAGEPGSETSDWYSLGVMLFEALTGHIPFDGTYVEVLKQKQAIDPPSPSQFVAGVPDDLDALCVRMLARDPSRRPSGVELMAALGNADTQVRPIATGLAEIRVPFLGRTHELGELERALAATDNGTPVVVLVHGLTGMGKTALVERFLEGATERGAVVLSGRCYEHEIVPLKALDSAVDVLSRYLGALSAAEAAEVVPRDVHALAQVFPVLQRVDVVRTARRRTQLLPDARSVQQQAHGALKEMLARIAMRQPLVLFIDDLQWGDVDSARMLAHLTSGSDRPAMLLVCTYRSLDRERSPCLSRLLPILRERRQVPMREISLEALSERESIELAERMLGVADEHAVALARESRGSPYLLTQLVEHMRTERQGLPAEDSAAFAVSLGRAQSGRLDALSPVATRVLELVAVSGRPLREQVMAKLPGSELNLAVALTELRRYKLVRGIGAADERAIGIYHDSVREAVLSRMERSAIAELHGRLATATENCEPVDYEALIHHLLGANDFSRAGIYAIGAARAAMDALAFDKAAELFEIAVQYHEDQAWRQELLAQWADALASAGRSLRAAEIYQRAAEGAAKDEALVLRRKAGIQLLVSGRWERGVEVLAPALAEIGIGFPSSSEEAIRLSMELRHALENNHWEFVPTAESELTPAVRERLDALWSVVQATLAANPMVCALFVRRHLLEALAAGEKKHVVFGLCAYFITTDVTVSWLSGRKAESLQRAEALCRELTEPRCHAWAALARGFAFQNEGLTKPALLYFEQAEDLLRNRCREGSPEMQTCRMLHARALAMSGDLDDLARCEYWIREAAAADDLLLMTRLRLVAIPRLLADDDLEQAERRLEAPVELRAEGFGLTGMLRFGARINLAMYRLDGVSLLRLAKKIDSLAKSPLLLSRLWRGDYEAMRARLLLTASRFVDEREELLSHAREAIDALEKLQMECHADPARILRASLAHLSGQREAALEALDTILIDSEMGGESAIVRACARMCKGHLLGGDAGHALLQDGERELRARGVKEPTSFARLYAPGFA